MLVSDNVQALQRSALNKTELLRTFSSVSTVHAKDPLIATWISTD